MSPSEYTQLIQEAGHQLVVVAIMASVAYVLGKLIDTFRP